MSDLSPAYGVPFMNKTRRGKNPMDILQQIVDRKPNAPDEEIREAWAERIMRDEDLTLMCLQSYAVNLLHSLRRVQAAPARQEILAAARVERETKVKGAVIQTFDRLSEMIFTLTFGEVAKLAGKSKQLLALSKLGKPTQYVSEVLTLAQIQRRLS